MAFHSNTLSNAKVIDVNRQLAEEYVGLLDDTKTKEFMAKFLKHNFFYLFKMLVGNHPADKPIELYAYQEILFKMLFEKDNVLCVMGRGIGKTTIAVWFIVLYSIIYPGSKIGILGPSFRKTREMFKGIVDLSGRKGAGLLRACIVDKKEAPDVCYMKIGTSEIYALPLGANGDKIRGYRFNLVVLDEAGFVPEKIITSVIIPFLSTNIDPIGQQRTKDSEDKLIEAGILKEENRTVIPNNKFLAFSSATYQFDYFYTLYKTYKKNILNPDPKEEKKASYGVFQMSYEAAPPGLLNLAATEHAKNSLATTEFDKEYRAIFPSDSNSFFKMSKMEACSIERGRDPSIEIVGQKSAKYLVSIDPNSMNESSTADHFAISVFKLDTELKEVVLVHQFAACQLNISDYVWYFLYILKNFNVVMIAVDKAGGDTFINICNESEMFKKENINLGFFTADFESDPKDYIKELNKARREYNPSSGKICFSQYFTNDWKHTANTHLQYCIEYKKLWFAAKPNDSKEEGMLDLTIDNFDKLRFYSGDEDESDRKARRQDFIDHQSELITEVKSQCALIEMKPTGNTITFELPMNIRRKRGEEQVRRDSWTALYLGVYMAKNYFDMMSSDERFNFNTNWVPYAL